MPTHALVTRLCEPHSPNSQALRIIVSTVGTISVIQDAKQMLDRGNCLSLTNSGIIPGQVMLGQDPGRGCLKKSDINGKQEVKNLSDSGFMHELNAQVGRKNVCGLSSFLDLISKVSILVQDCLQTITNFKDNQSMKW